ncbi:MULTISPECIES: hypothetical protein [Bacillus]|uniref:hypothetical protein n=1 Tax=Bacillus TaxID=1386 RepID=UPI0011A7F09D|nr:hypothetical protein [Bacillus safensis]UXO88089.1 hypothetical protein N7921_19550 [Bacillus safensis]
MSLMFYPERTAFIDASFPHPPNTQYRISVGVENWNGVFVPVQKIQMVYNGKVSGRKSPSYPVDSDDFVKVYTQLLALINEANFESQKAKEVSK